jgi:hypothetical protein
MKHVHFAASLESESRDRKALHPEVDAHSDIELLTGEIDAALLDLFKCKRHADAERLQRTLDDLLKSFELEIYEYSGALRDRYRQRLEQYRAQIKALGAKEAAQSTASLQTPTATARQELFRHPETQVTAINVAATHATTTTTPDVELMDHGQILDAAERTVAVDVKMLRGVNVLLETETLPVATQTAIMLQVCCICLSVCLFVDLRRLTHMSAVTERRLGARRRRPRPRARQLDARPAPLADAGSAHRH